MLPPHLPEAAWGLAVGVALLVAVGSTPRREGHKGPPFGFGRIRSAEVRGGGGRSGRAGSRGGGTEWASRGQVGPLVVSGPTRGRLVLGTLAGGGRRGRRTLLAAEVTQSVAVIGPTQSGKTTSLAVPAILGWEGPLVAASVKTDLVLHTLDWRRGCGEVWCFDPGRATGLPAAEWSPLLGARTWSGALRVAADLTEVMQGATTSADGEFWYATAAKLLAPLLFAAARGGLTMHDVVRWVDTQEVAEVVGILEGAGVPTAVQAARATWQRDERQRSSVYTTAEMVLAPFAEPGTGASGTVDTPPYGIPARGRPRGSTRIDPAVLLAGSNTLYLCAPAHDQRRLRGLFTAVVKQVVEAAFESAARGGGPLSPPLLIVLDEAANISPLAELDSLAATCAGHGIQLMTVWQDLSQVRARYGERAPTVINNHRAKIFLSGTSDPATLDHASGLVGDEEPHVPSISRDPYGGRTVTSTPSRRRLLPPEDLRRLPTGTGVLVYGALPPIRLGLQPWFRSPVLAPRGGGRASLRS